MQLLKLSEDACIGTNVIIRLLIGRQPDKHASRKVDRVGSPGRKQASKQLRK